jgi:hypothetical protein
VLLLLLRLPLSSSNNYHLIGHVSHRVQTDEHLPHLV